MTNITSTDVRVNYNNSTIVITKKFSKKIANPLNEEFKEFMELRNMLPEYKVVVKDTPKKSSKRETLKGLNYDFMKQYIARHDEDGENMKSFTTLKQHTIYFKTS
jgi:hypothetical protein